MYACVYLCGKFALKCNANRHTLKLNFDFVQLLLGFKNCEFFFIYGYFAGANFRH